MLRLVAARMVYWHGYQDETVTIEGTTLVTGENGVGKTTLLDAIQFALVADQTRVRFNKANTGSVRKLVGYCRWLVMAEEEGARGKGTYLRGACNSYVMLGWEDADAPARKFVCGVVIESGSGESILQQSHFVIPGIRVGDVPAVEAERPLAIADLRLRLKANGWTLIPDARTYRKTIGHRLAYLDDTFYEPIIKALDFKPLGSIRPFITDFLLEERPIETGRLLRNVENYQRLEAEARAARDRLEALREILERHVAFERAQNELALMEYVLMRARIDELDEKLRRLDTDLTHYQQQAERADAQAGRHTVRLGELDRDLEAVVERLAGVAASRQRKELERELEFLALEIQEIEQAARDLARKRLVFHEMLAKATSPEAAEARRRLPGLAEDPFGKEDVVERCRVFLAAEEPDGRRQRSLETSVGDAIRLYPRIKAEAEAALTEANRLYAERRAELAELEQGRQRYRPHLSAILHLLRARLTYDGEIRPLCELIEVRDELWTDALEAMLGEDRFAIVLPAEQYRAARGLYHRHKEGYAYPGSGGPISLHSVKLIDMGGVLGERNRGAQPGSLAEAAATEDALARAYLDYRVGNVICVRRVEELNHHPRAVTPDVMVHQGHGTFRMNPRNYEEHFIGHAARVRRREVLRAELERLQSAIASWGPLVDFLESLQSACLGAFQELPEYMRIAARAYERSGKLNRAGEIRRQIERLDQDPELRTFTAERERLHAEIEKTRAAAADAAGMAKALRQQAESTTTEISRTAEEAARRRGELSGQFPLGDPSGRVLEYEARYMERRAEGLGPSEIIAIYEPQKSGRETARTNRRDELKDVQLKFSARFDLSPPENPADVSAYREDQFRIEETRLPEYQTKLAEAKEEARRQLGEHYAYQLYDCFEGLKNAFDDINRALRAEEVRNNWGRYRFETSLIKGYQQIYELAYSVGQTGKDSLFNAEILAGPVGQELDRLTESLLSAGSAKAVESALITDYRDFFDYDLVLEQTDGKVVRFANVSGVGSGGENQVPYYVAIFSALYQMWRKQMPTRKPGCGLVMLDEAFSKMDEKNMDMVLDLAQRFALQLILVTPGERVAVIAPRVETTLLVHRDNARADAIPLIRRFTRDQLIDAFQAVETEHAAAVATA
jgi:uncharacterized protein YPO0396